MRRTVQARPLHANGMDLESGPYGGHLIHAGGMNEHAVGMPPAHVSPLVHRPLKRSAPLAEFSKNDPRPNKAHGRILDSSQNILDHVPMHIG